MFLRLLKLPKQHSFFLFGPRGTGKSTLIKNVLPAKESYTLDLLDYELSSRLNLNPAEFKQIMAAIDPKIKWIIIDEIQKIPALLDEVHRLIEKGKKWKFALTGSSARKLKQGQANLLAGRAFAYHLFPLTSVELLESFHLDTALQYGTLPYLSALPATNDKVTYLKTYAQTYLKEEILSEGIIRNLQAFRNFLPLAAQSNGHVLSWNNFAKEVGIDAKTIRSYFEILEDTMIGFILPAYQRSLRKRQKTHPKFYFFDTGVKRALANELSLPLVSKTSEYGRAFEHFWICEIKRMNEYLQKDYVFSYFATNDVEIDLLIETPQKEIILVEFKSTRQVKDFELKPLLKLCEELPRARAVCISNEPRKRKIGSVLICPWQEALKELGLYHS